MMELIREAQEMLIDRRREERDLIYAIAKLDSEERAAIILAYEFLIESNE